MRLEELSDQSPLALSRAVRDSIGRTLAIWRGEAPSAAGPAEEEQLPERA